jgi:uncharacterized protein YndB with AHSA1/START domain
MPEQSNAPATEEALVITRVFDAPVELVWKAWSEPERYKQWWGPEHFTAPVIEMDFRVGGRFLGCMRAPDGKEFWSSGTYREIEPLKRIVTTDSFSDDIPLEMMLTVTFEDLGEKTRLTIRHEGMPSLMRESANAGWDSSLDKLAASLAA